MCSRRIHVAFVSSYFLKFSEHIPNQHNHLPNQTHRPEQKDDCWGFPLTLVPLNSPWQVDPLRVFTLLSRKLHCSLWEGDSAEQLNADHSVSIESWWCQHYYCGSARLNANSGLVLMEWCRCCIGVHSGKQISHIVSLLVIVQQGSLARY